MKDKSTPRTDEQEFRGISGDWEELVVESDFSRILERENNELRELVRLLTIQEMSDSGCIFYPTSVSSCRCLDLERIGQITEKYRPKPHISTEDED